MQVFIFCLMSSKYGHEFSHIMSPGARPICRAVSDVIFCVFNVEYRARLDNHSLLENCYS